jgi:hypothetical protein
MLAGPPPAKWGCKLHVPHQFDAKANEILTKDLDAVRAQEILMCTLAGQQISPPVASGSGEASTFVT